tara:strand:- start:27 stop:641 length:615 start_codon:yes stop_codon:yes gene_type:complete
MLVLSSPSGAGKTTIAQRLLKADKNVRMSVSVTTRPQRENELPGKDYHFVNTKTFQQMQKNGELLEYATVFGHFYGTPREKVEELLAGGNDIVFDIDWQGAQQITEKARDDVVKIFILPPSTKELERRLKNRAQDSEDVVATRMKNSASEITHWAEYDYVLINQTLDHTMKQVLTILSAERMRRHRGAGISKFVEQLISDSSQT